MKGNPRYALVRVDGTSYCPSRYEKINRDFVCAGLPYCHKCRYGDSKEQMIQKILQAIIIDVVKTAKVNDKKTIQILYKANYKLAKFIAEFLGVEE